MINQVIVSTTEFIERVHKEIDSFYTATGRDPQVVVIHSIDRKLIDRMKPFQKSVLQAYLLNKMLVVTSGEYSPPCCGMIVYTDYNLKGDKL